jgi:hypothetical protein
MDLTLTTSKVVIQWQQMQVAMRIQGGNAAINDEPSIPELIFCRRSISRDRLSEQNKSHTSYTEPLS